MSREKRGPMGTRLNDAAGGDDVMPLLMLRGLFADGGAAGGAVFVPPRLGMESQASACCDIVPKNTAR